MVDAIAPDAHDVYGVGRDGEFWIATFRLKQMALDYVNWITPSIGTLLPGVTLEVRELD